MPNKTLISNFNVMKDNDTLTYETHSISAVFKNFFSSLAESLLTKLPNPPDNKEVNLGDGDGMEVPCKLKISSPRKIVEILCKKVRCITKEGK